MDTIIVYRVSGGKLEVVLSGEGDHGDVAVFRHHDDAVLYAENSRLFQSGQADYQIVTLDEL